MGLRKDDIGFGNLQLLQEENDFCYGIDAVLISDFMLKHCKNPKKVLDLGTGNGIIPLILSASLNKTEFIGIEVQSKVVDIARQNMLINNLEKRCVIECENIKKALFKNYEADVVISNPPYIKFKSGIKNLNMNKAISRHEVKAKLEDFFKLAAKVLPSGGEFYMVHRPFRLAEIFDIARNNRMEAKKVRFVFPYMEADAKMVLLQFIKNAAQELKVESPLIIRGEDGEFTQEIKDIYGGKK